MSDSPSRVIRWVLVAYLALQGLACTLWWCVLVLWPATRRAFVPAVWPDGTILAFWLPDAVLWIAGSWVAALAVARCWRFAPALVVVLAGATTYPALYCLAVSARTGEAWLVTLFMVPAAAATCVCAWLVGGALATDAGAS